MKTRLAKAFYVMLVTALILGSALATGVVAQESSEPPPAAQVINDEGRRSQNNRQGSLHVTLLRNRGRAADGYP